MRTMGILKFVPIGMLMAVAIGASICGCGSGASGGTTSTIPTITSLSPTSSTAGGTAFTLTVFGSNFVSSSVVRWNGSDRPTTFVGSSQLTAQISASDIVATGTATVTVFNPGSSGGTSNASNFAINNSTNPIPTISFLSPAATAVGGPGFTFVVVGSNFVPSSVVRWNGNDRPTAFVNGGEIHAQISASDIAVPGTADITVFNPAPGGGISTSFIVSILTGVGPFSVAVAPDPSGKFGKFAYVANSTSNNVSMYAINPTTGTLEPTGAVAAGTSPKSVTVDSSGKFAYVANSTSNNVSMYMINPTTGTLEPIGTVTAGTSPKSVAVVPSGKFAYVANQGSNDISMYAINPATGTLQPMGTVAAGKAPSSVAVDLSGKFAYVADGFPDDNVSMYTINATTGALTSTGTIAAGNRPSSVAVDPSGKFTYVANCDDAGDVSMYIINATTGTLTSTGTAAAASRPCSVAVDPSGKFAYAANQGEGCCSANDGVSMYTINSSTGALTSIGLMNGNAGWCPTSLAMDPSGKFAYVANLCSNDISMYMINATTGALTLIGKIGT